MSPKPSPSAHTYTRDIRCTQPNHTIASCSSGLAQNCLQSSLLLPTLRYQPRVICPPSHPHRHHNHHTSVLFLHVREYFQPSLNEVTIRVPTGRGPGYSARTARRSLMRRQGVTAFRIPVNPLLSPPPFAHNHVFLPGARALSFTFRSFCLPRFAHLAPCLPRVRVLLVESVLPGFPPPDGSGSGCTVLARCRLVCSLRFELPFQSSAFAPAAAAALRASSAVGSRFLCVPALLSRCQATSCIAESASAPVAALRASSGFRSGGPASCGMDVCHRGIGFGSWCCCFESFERHPVRWSGSLWNGHPSSWNRFRLLL